MKLAFCTEDRTDDEILRVLSEKIEGMHNDRLGKMPSR